MARAKIMKKPTIALLAALAAAGLLLCGGEALALGAPVPGGLNLQEAASPTMERIHAFHNMMLWIIGSITALVLLLLIYVCARFNDRVNPVPSKVTHNTLVEVLWTLVPVLILVVIFIPSMQLLYYSDRTTDPDMTLKVTGYQWYWGFEYPDHDHLSFNSYMVPDDQIDIAAGQKRLLSTDTPVYLPIDTNIQILVTAADVIHAFAVPAFGVKIDAVPGRLNETWVRITKPGTYYGQCSELCGRDHAFMPVEIRAVTMEEFEAWLEQAHQEFSSLDTRTAENIIKLAKLEDVE